MIPTATRRLILSLVLIAACAICVVAQDAGQVLRLSVGFNTMKNSNSKMSDQLRTDVERLSKLAQQANAAGKYGDAMKHLHHGMALMSGQRWTPGRALSSALTLKVDRAVLEPSQPINLQLGQLFALDEKIQGKLSGAVTLVKMQSDEQFKLLKALDAIDPDLAANPAAVQVSAPDVPDGNYRILVKLLPAGEEAIIKRATVHIARGLVSQIAAARKRTPKIEQKLRAKKQDALLALLASAEYRLSLSDLADGGSLNFDRIDFRSELKEAVAILDGLDSGRDPLAARRGDFRKAYRSKVDNTLQPYRIFVPSGYDKSKAHPLIIALHGMGGNENSYFDGYSNGAFKVEAEKRGYIVACPKGREPASMYRGSAEQDVMDVIAEVRRVYNIDNDRVYMTGHSMGGYGTWSVAMNHPEVFAALAPVAGGGLPAGQSKIAHIPQLVVHGDDDKTVPVGSSRVMVEAARKLGIEVKYIEVPRGNHVDIVVPTFKDVFDWFDAHKRKCACEGGSTRLEDSASPSSRTWRRALLR
jgi:predicted esterase